MRSKLRPPLLSHPTPAQRPEQRPLLNTRAAAPRPLLRPNAEPRAGASSPRRSASPPLSPGECHRPEAPSTNRGPASRSQGQMRPRESEAPIHRAYPPSVFPTPLRRSTRPPPAPVLQGPETPEVRPRRGSASPVSATIPWPPRTERPPGRAGWTQKRVFDHRFRGSPPWHSFQRSEREAGAGEGTRREERASGWKGRPEGQRDKDRRSKIKGLGAEHALRREPGS